MPIAAVRAAPGSRCRRSRLNRANSLLLMASLWNSRAGLADMEMLAELFEIGPLAHQDDAIAGRENLVAVWGKFEPAVVPLDGDDDHAGASLDVSVTKAQSGQGARRSD